MKLNRVIIKVFIVFLMLLISQSVIGQPTMGESTLRPHIPVYGEMITWEEVKEIIPRKSTFQVIDLETGMSFEVQRRAGSDVLL